MTGVDGGAGVPQPSVEEPPVGFVRRGYSSAGEDGAPGVRCAQANAAQHHNGDVRVSYSSPTPTERSLARNDGVELHAAPLVHTEATGISVEAVAQPDCV